MAPKLSGIRDIGHKALSAARSGDGHDKVAAIAIRRRGDVRELTTSVLPDAGAQRSAGREAVAVRGLRRVGSGRSRERSCESLPE